VRQQRQPQSWLRSVLLATPIGFCKPPQTRLEEQLQSRPFMRGGNDSKHGSLLQDVTVHVVGE
jgi:hypothetical protein